LTAIKENYKGQDGHFKNTQAFSQRGKACSVFRLRSPLRRGTMPA